ncbi:MAG: hypothetical protein R3C17_13470 [Planctomycetaceae bacterium]
MPLHSENPYRAPQQIDPGRTRLWQFSPTLAWWLPVTVLGSALTANFGVQTYSVTVTLVPSGVSFAIAMWLVIRGRKFPVRYLPGGILFVGAITSIATASLYLDNIGWFPRFAAASELAVAASIGAACFSSSVALSCLRLQFKTTILSTVGAFITFFITAFTALVMLEKNRMSPHVLYIIFLCSACFQAVVIVTASVVTHLLFTQVPIDQQSGG